MWKVNKITDKTSYPQLVDKSFKHCGLFFTVVGKNTCYMIKIGVRLYLLEKEEFVVERKTILESDFRIS